MLHRTFSAEEQRHFLSVIVGESVRLTNLLDDFLDVQKADAGRMRLAQTRFEELGPMLEELVELFSFSGDTPADIDLELDSCLGPVFVDPDRIKQILANLLSNAIKFSPDGGKIRVEGRVLEESFVRVTVIDQGMGIPPADVDKVFSKFFRSEHDHQVRGSGLGLALVKTLVTMHGGRVALESTVGVGTRIWFDLPLVDENNHVIRSLKEEL